MHASGLVMPSLVEQANKLPVVDVLLCIPGGLQQHAYAHTCVSVCVYTCRSVGIFTCANIHIYIYIYIYI